MFNGNIITRDFLANISNMKLQGFCRVISLVHLDYLLIRKKHWVVFDP